MRKPFSAVATLLLLLITHGLHAQPDFSGYWMISFGPIPPQRQANPEEQAMIDALPPGTLLLADSGLREFPPGEFGGLQATPAAKAIADRFDPEIQRNADTTCIAPSIIYSMQGPFPLEIVQGSELLVIKMEYFDVVRIIHIGLDSHPDNLPATTAGHSIARWEGDTLVVDTTRIKASTLLNNGMNHTEDMHLVERFRLSADGNSLFITQVYEDPAMFEGRAARLIPLNKGGADEHIWPYDCDPTYGAAIDARERR